MPTSRPRNALATRNAILAAARVRFGAEGFERTTLRAVARDVGVDAALVSRYFGTKQGLFTAAAELRLDIPDLTGTPPERIAEVVLPYFFQVWEDNGTFLALLRAAMTSPTAAAVMTEAFAAHVGPALAPVTPDHHDERAGLFGALMIGIATTRNVLKTPGVSAMTRQQIIDWTKPILEDILTGPAPDEEQP